jgi:hypothetical protein
LVYIASVATRVYREIEKRVNAAYLLIINALLQLYPHAFVRILLLSVELTKDEYQTEAEKPVLSV